MGSGRARTARAEEQEMTHGEAHVAGGNMSVRAVVPPPPVDVRAVERILGYTFRDKALVERALTHASYEYYRPDTGELVTEPSYERLEFVGDAVLNCVVARFLYWEYEELPPGPLTRLRSANVDTEKLARVAVRSGVYKYLRHRPPYPFGQIEEFRKTMSDYPLHSNGLLDPPKVLADVVEALLGAVFVDSNNIEAVWKVFERLSEPVIRLETLGKHPTSELYELCQKRRMEVRFQTADWRETNAVEVLVDGKLAGRGTYGQKKEVAQNRAAKAALDHLKMMFANGDASPGRSNPEELQAEDPMLGREEIMNSMPDHASSGESDDDGKTTAPVLANREELQEEYPILLGREEMMDNTSDHTPSDGGGKTALLHNTEELQEYYPMLGREEIMYNTSDHTSSGDSDDGGETAVLQNTEEDPMLGREEIMNSMPDHAISSGESDDDGKTAAVLANRVELRDPILLGREGMNMSDHTPADDGGKTAVLANREELHDPVLGREEIMNSCMPDHTSSGDGSDDDGETAAPPNTEEDPMLGREEIMNSMPDHASSGESDDDGKTAVLANREELQDPILLGREGMNMSDHTPADDGGKTAALANREEELHDPVLGREEIMNNCMPDHTSSGDSDDDGETDAPPNTEELHDHMLGRRQETIMNNMPDQASSGESDDDGETAVLP